jgi:hypothetical protein
MSQCSMLPYTYCTFAATVQSIFLKACSHLVNVMQFQEIAYKLAPPEKYILDMFLRMGLVIFATSIQILCVSACTVRTVYTNCVFHCCTQVIFIAVTECWLYGRWYCAGYRLFV